MPMMLWIAVLNFSLLWLAGPSTGRPDLAPAFAVIEKVAGFAGFYLEDGRRIGEVKLGSFPHEAVLSPDGRLLFVSDNGVLWLTDEGAGGNTISIVDVHQMRKTGEIDLGRFRRPHGLAWDAAGKRLLVTTERPDRLLLVDPFARRVLRDYDVEGKCPHMVSLGPGGDWAFVSNVDSSAVAAVELKTGAVELIPVGARPQGSVLAPGGKRLYVVASGADSVTVIDPLARKAIGVIPTGKGPGRIAITPDGKTLVYNLQGDLSVGFADVASGKQVAVVDIGGRSLSLTMTPDGGRAFAGIQDQDRLVVISVAERKIVRVIPTPKGAGPDPVVPFSGTSASTGVPARPMLSRLP
jgi:YVTN family beta-propeller protein